jgi:GNAT superfamily N-acetyltransferase
MRAQEFVAEAKTVDYEGLTLKVSKNDHELMVDALDDWGNNVLGHVTFYIGDDRELDPQDLWVNEKYQGQGIARVMYDYVKKLGYKIVRSWDQTDAGAGFWDKHRGQDVRVWEQDVTEGQDDNGISFQIQKGKNKFATTMTVNNEQVGVYQYDANTGRSVAEVYPEFKGKGLGKLLVLHAIYTAAQLGLNFQEDESRTAEYDNVLDSLSNNGHIVDDDGYWYVTGEGEQYLQQSMKQGVADQQLDELSFLGSECTKDCSGHRAGYDWSKRKGLRQANSWSPSFNKGAGLAVAGK